jgi:hypothetical protein
MKFKKSMGISVVFALLFVFSSQAHAQSATLTLKRSSLSNSSDTAGSWQYEGGKVYITATGNNMSAIAYIGDYAITRRTITGGTDTQNTAMMTMTIFLQGENPPQNITLQGSHDFSNGNFIGSVSAGSGNYSSLVGATFSGNAGSSGMLTITN